MGQVTGYPSPNPYYSQNSGVSAGSPATQQGGDQAQANVEDSIAKQDYTTKQSIRKKFITELNQAAKS